MSKGRGSKGNAVAQRARRNARKQAAREAQLETAARDSAALTAIPSRTTLSVANPGNPTGHQARGQPSQKTSQISTTEERALASRSVYSLRGPAVEAGQKRTAEQAQLEFVAREKRRRELASTSQGPTATTSRKDSALGLGQQRMTNQEKLAPVATERPSTTSSIPAAAAENPARGLVRRMSNLQLKPHSENMIDVPSPPQQDADGDATELERENLAAAIFVPVPPFDKDDDGPQDRDAMLRDVANLESHYEKVWANIVGLQSSQTEDVERELNSLLNSAHQTEDGDQATYIANMLANINRPHKDEDSSPAAPVLQKSSANETKLMENYRTRAQEHIDTYRQDLDSNVSLGGSGDGGIRRPSHGDTAMGTSPISRRGSIIPPAMRGAIDDAANSTGDIVMGGTEEATAQSPPPAFNSTYGRDISRDPRRK